MTSDFDALRIYDSASMLLDTWLNIRPDYQVCPSKKNLMPMALGRALPDVFLVEWHSIDQVIIRVAGSRTSEVTDGDTTGMNVFDVCLPEHVTPLQKFYQKMTEGKTAGVAEQVVRSSQGSLVAKTMQLPLLNKQGQPRFFVGTTRRVPNDTKQQNTWPMIQDQPMRISVWYRDLPPANIVATEKAI